MADIIGAIVELLLADASVTDLAGENVFGTELPGEIAKLMPRNAIVIQPAGGAPFAPGSKVEVGAQRLDLVAYGATAFEADELRRKAGKSLFAVDRRVTPETRVLVHWVQSAGGYSSGRDTDAKWPYAFQSLQTLFATDEVAS